MATATKLRLRFVLANSRVIRPGWWMGDQSTNGAVTASQLQAMIDAARAELVANSFMAGFDDSVIFQEVEAQNFNRIQTGTRPDPDDPEGPPLPVYGWEATTTTYETSGADVPGGQALDALPPRNAFVWTLKSSEPGPAGRNRFFGPPLVDSEVNALGAIDSARVTQLTADLLAIAGAAGTGAGGSFAQVVASAQNNDLYAVNVRLIQPLVKSQRPRG